MKVSLGVILTIPSNSAPMNRAVPFSFASSGFTRAVITGGYIRMFRIFTRAFILIRGRTSERDMRGNLEILQLSVFKTPRIALNPESL
ncbi:MAG: hypothetical protein HC820_05920 [Hydrococcus sp. RM1_1_31]|nr:hypothetical protein [Hydrococcus sp. RM1_1_31]